MYTLQIPGKSPKDSYFKVLDEGVSLEQAIDNAAEMLLVDAETKDEGHALIWQGQFVNVILTRRPFFRYIHHFNLQDRNVGVIPY